MFSSPNSSSTKVDWYNPSSIGCILISLSLSLFQFVISLKEMSRPGDWNCQSCNHLNFQRRGSCQRCGEPRPGSLGGGRSGSSFRSSAAMDVRLGDWYCNVGGCGVHNFASRSSCFKCGAAKAEPPATGGGYDCAMPRMRGFGYGNGSGASRSGWKLGDWICGRPGCNEHNFASRTECFRCNSPRESGGKSSSSS